jgi:hypothetical protein
MLSCPLGDSSGGRPSIDLSTYSTPTPLDDHPKTRLSKIIRRNKNASIMKHANNCASSLTLKGHFHPVTMIPHPRFGYIVTLDSKVLPKV